MSRWWRAHSEARNDPKLMLLPPAEFKRKFFKRLDGEENEFSAFVRPVRTHDMSPEWRRLRAAVFERDDFTCQYCGERAGRLECDHVFPVSRGGVDHLDNLVAACVACNRSKGAKTLEEWHT